MVKRQTFQPTYSFHRTKFCPLNLPFYKIIYRKSVCPILTMGLKRNIKSSNCISSTSYISTWIFFLTFQWHTVRDTIKDSFIREKDPLSQLNSLLLTIPRQIFIYLIFCSSVYDKNSTLVFWHLVTYLVNWRTSSTPFYIETPPR